MNDSDPNPKNLLGADWRIVLRSGWHRIESHGDAIFRWAENDAQIVVSTFVPMRALVRLDIEPGPDAGVAPFHLSVLDTDGSIVLEREMLGRSIVELPVRANGPQVTVFRFVFEKTRADEPRSERRILDLRAFGISLEPEPPDVLQATSNCYVGSGWFPIETWEGVRFRWVENDALIIVEPEHAEEIELEIEPGPGLRGDALDLRAMLGITVLRSYRIETRCRIAIPLPNERARASVVRLNVINSGHPTDTDRRILNFRAFCEAT